MSLQESEKDNMNRMATDIEECPECDSEDLQYLGHGFDEESGTSVDHMQCMNCTHVFKIHL